ncbi:MAG: S8 family serine peptidase [Pseudobdellovibrionaceae bacterium]
MKKVIGILVLLAFSLPVFAAEYLVKYRSTQAFQTFSRSSALRILDVHDAGNLMKVTISEANKVSAMIQLLTDPNVEYVVPNARMHLFTTPLETETMALKQQWAIQKVRAEEAWKKAGNKGSKKVVVAVIDTGVDSKHPSLSPNMVAGYDFAGNDSDPMDEVGQNPGHGTHCAGIVGSTGLVEGGTTGISPEVSIMPIRFLDKNGGGDLNNGVKAIDYAIEKGVDVISASWGAAIPKAQAMPIIEAMQRAEKAGIVFVVAAANDGKNNDTYEVYPANAGLSNTISVAASDSSDAKPSWSNYGKAKVNLASPGNEIMSTLPSNKYGNLSGTSMATPLVAGLVAFAKAQDPSLSPTQIRSLLQATGAASTVATACDCRVDALGVVEAIQAKKIFVSPFAATVAPGQTLEFEAVYGKKPFQFASSNAAVATIDANGILTAVANGETQITVKDAAGATATSHKIYVGQSSSDGGGGGADPGTCPLGDQALCDVLCQVMPDMPFCQQ